MMVVVVVVAKIKVVEPSRIDREKRFDKGEGMGLIISGCPHLPLTTCHTGEAPGSF